MPHPDEGLIHAWLDGELDADEAARVEALVAQDAEWAAAAAEARGLVAASSRIVGALDHVPANVIPKGKAVPRRPRWWMMQAAAALLVVAVGATVVRQSRTPEAPFDASPPEAAVLSRVVPLSPAPAPAAGPAESRADALSRAVGGTAVPSVDVAQRAAVPAAGAGVATTAANSAAEEPKAVAKAAAEPSKENVVSADRLADRRVTAQLSVDRVEPQPAAGVGASQRADSGLARVESFGAPPAAAFAPGAGAAGALGAASAARVLDQVRAVCFETRPAADSARRILRFPATALQDSVRRGTMVVSRDSLLGVPRRLIGIAIPCPIPPTP